MTKPDEPRWDRKPRTPKKQPEGDRATGARIFRTSGPATGTRDEHRLFSIANYRPEYGKLPDNARAYEAGLKAEAKKAKEAAAEKEKKKEEYMKEWRRLYEEEEKRFVAARAEYEEAEEKYTWEVKAARAQRDDAPKKPAILLKKRPEFKEPVVPNARERFGSSFAGGRRTRRGRKSRYTRRR
jgi:hypothetical protein